VRVAVPIYLAILIICLAISGCAHDGEPVVPASRPAGSDTHIVNPSLGTDTAGHQRYTWIYVEISIDPSTGNVEITPFREVSTHWNILYFLENYPCVDCLKITNSTPTGNGTFLVDVEISHPFENAKFTGFDVRGVILFDGGYSFPESGLNIPDSSFGDGCLENPDGYTTLYNHTTEGAGPDGLQGYQRGRFSSEIVPDAVLNGYKMYSSDGTLDSRHIFYAGDDVTVTYEIRFPDGDFIFGYAVDSSWVKPDVDPVLDPINDFPPEANCPEPWNIALSVVSIDFGLNQLGGQANLIIDVYDWQGSTSHTEPVIECPGLFNGIVTANYVQDIGGYTRYETLIENEFPAPAGSYNCLVAVEDNENLTSPEWLDLTSYQVISVEVAYREFPPVALAGFDPPGAICEEVHFYDDGSFDPDGGDIVTYEWDWDNDGTFDEEGADVYHRFNIAGQHRVQFRVTDDEGQIDKLDIPLILEVGSVTSPFNLENVTPLWMNLIHRDVEISGNYLYIVGNNPGMVVIYDNSDPVNPVPISFVELDDDSYSRFLKVDGEYAFVIQGDSGLKIIDVNPPESASLVQTVQFYEAVDCEIAGGYAYIMEMYSGIRIIDIDPPEEAHIVNTIDAAWQTKIKVDGGYAYLGNRTTFRIVDIDPPEDASVVAEYSVDHIINDSWVGDGLAILAFGEFGIAILDVSDPTSPQEISTFLPDIPTSRILHVADGYLYAYGPSGNLQVIDIDPPESPETVAEYTIESEVKDVHASNGRLYLTSRRNFYIFDISGPGQLDLLSSVQADQFLYDFCVDGGYAYSIIANTDTIILDIEPPETAYIAGYVASASGAHDVQIIDNTCYAGGNKKLTTLDVTDPENPVITGTAFSDGYIFGVYTDGSFAYVDVDAGEILNVYEYQPSGVPEFVNSIDLLTPFYDPYIPAFERVDNYLYVGTDTFHVIDISSPDSPVIVGSIPDQGFYRWFCHQDQYLHTVSNSTFLTYDISSPSTPEEINSVSLDDNLLTIALRDGYAYVGAFNDAGFYGIHVIDIDPIGDAHTVDTIEIGEQFMPMKILFRDNYAYVADGYYGLRILDVTDPDCVFLVDSIYVNNMTFDIDLTGDFAYMGSVEGINIIKLM